MKALCTEQLEPKSKHNLAVFLAEQGCHWSWASQEKSLYWQRFETVVQELKGVRTAICRIFKKNILNLILLLQLASRNYLPYFSPLNNFFPITLIKATTFSAGIVRTIQTCQVSPDAQISWLSSPYGNSQVPQLSEAWIWTWDSSFHEGICYTSRPSSKHSHCEPCDRIWILFCIFFLYDLPLCSFTPPFSLQYCSTSLIQHNRQESMKAEAALRLEQLVFLMASCPKER